MTTGQRSWFLAKKARKIAKRRTLRRKRRTVERNACSADEDRENASPVTDGRTVRRYSAEVPKYSPENTQEPGKGEVQAAKRPSKCLKMGVRGGAAWSSAAETT